MLNTLHDEEVIVTRERSLNERPGLTKQKKENFKTGLLTGIAVVIIWGFLPMFWKLLKIYDPFFILGNRIFWSLLILFLLLIFKGNFKTSISAYFNRSHILMLLLTSLLILTNWYIFIWAVNSNKVLETSMGYFLYPLLSAAFGIFVLNEKPGKLQKLSLIIVVVAVIILAVFTLNTSWISFALAITFGVYGFLRKIYSVKPLEGLFIETLILSPLAIYLLIAFGNSSVDSSHFSGKDLFLLIATGFATAFPMLLFVVASKNLSLTRMGLLFYVTPTIMFLTAIFVYSENLTMTSLVSFVLIWIGIFMYNFSRQLERVLNYGA